jgi:predicted enzyme related to lactoylglutathione lyase
LSIPGATVRRSCIEASLAVGLEDEMSKNGEFRHLELPADDVNRAQAFYSAVFGWQFRPMEEIEGYVLYTAGPGELGGGIGKRGDSAADAVRNYITVDSIEAALDAASANGGAIVVPKTDIGIGWYAAITDTEGNELGLYKSKTES